MTRLITLLVLAFAPILAAQDQFTSLPSRWHCHGGDASRSYSSATRMDASQLSQSWAYQAPGKLCAPPLTWEQNTILLEQLPKGKAILKVLDAQDGSLRLKSPPFPCLPQTKLCVWGRTIGVKSESQKITFWRLGYTKIFRSRSLTTKSDVLDLLLIRNKVFVGTANKLSAYEVRTLKPMWSATGQFCGNIAVTDEEVYALDYSTGAARVAVYGRNDGAPICNSDMPGPTEAPGESAPFQGEVQVFQGTVVARFGGAITQRGGVNYNTIIMKRTGKGKLTRLEASGVVETRSPAIFHDGKLVFHGGITDLKNRVLACNVERGSFLPLINADDRKELLNSDSTICMKTSSTAWINDCAFRLGDRRLLRLGGETKIAWAIPMHDGILFVDRDLLSIRVLRDPAHMVLAKAVPMGPAKGEVQKGLALLRNGKLIKGHIEFDSSTNRLSRVRSNGKKKNYDLKDVLVIQSADSKIVMAPSEAAFLLGLSELRDLELAEAYEDFAGKALKSQDIAFVTRMIAEATAHGAEDSSLKSVTKRLASLEKKKKRKVNLALVKELQELVRIKERGVREKLWERIKDLPAEAPKKLRIKMLRDLFAHIPNHRAASELVNSWLPKKLQKKRLKTPASWLDFVVASDQVAIEILDVPTAEMKETTWEQRQLGLYQARWRKDIVAVQSKRLLVMSPLQNPSQVARCLALGETVCDALAKIFVGGAKKRNTSRPLIIHLFPTKKSFIDYGRKRGMAGIGNVLGYYSPDENLTRMFLPDTEEELEMMRATFVHELTHHWTFQRCPLFSARDASRQTISLPGVWIVEGFAVMMSDFVYDPTTRSYSVFNPKAHPLDVVSNATEDQMYPWKDFLKLAQGHLLGMRTMTGPPVVVKLKWSVGAAAAQTPTNVFYSQAGALCHFLLRADGGLYKKELINFVALFYRGKSRSWSPEKALGMTAEELGRRVHAFAKAETSRELKK